MENSEDETGNKNSVACENIKPEVLNSPKSFLKIFRNVYVGFCIRKIICNQFSCTVSRILD